MSRYSLIGKTLSSTNKELYKTTKYPEIPLSLNDIYIYTTRGDSLDSLALAYYKNSSLWWVISIANPNLSCDTIYPPAGTQLRIPTNISEVLTLFDNINTPL